MLRFLKVEIKDKRTEVFLGVLANETVPLKNIQKVVDAFAKHTYFGTPIKEEYAGFHNFLLVFSKGNCITHYINKEQITNRLPRKLRVDKYEKALRELERMRAWHNEKAVQQWATLLKLHFNKMESVEVKDVSNVSVRHPLYFGRPWGLFAPLYLHNGIPLVMGNKNALLVLYPVYPIYPVHAYLPVFITPKPHTSQQTFISELIELLNGKKTLPEFVKDKFYYVSFLTSKTFETWEKGTQPLWKFLYNTRTMDKGFLIKTQAADTTFTTYVNLRNLHNPFFTIIKQNLIAQCEPSAYLPLLLETLLWENNGT
jgi:hypothetical protein